MESTKKKAIKGQGRPPSLFTEEASFLLCIQMSSMSFSGSQKAQHSSENRLPVSLKFHNCQQ